jgi:hypothetical protein
LKALPALDDLDAEFGFELLDSRGKRRLRDVTRTGSPSEMALLG